MTRKPAAEQIAVMLDQIYMPIRSEIERMEEVLGGEAKSGIEMADSIFRFVMDNGGKRIRPAIFLLAARISGTGGKRLASIGASIEMLHQASLLHDDVVDDASVRRGRRAVRVRWGNQASILVGDYIWSRAVRILVKDGDASILDAASDAVGSLVEGELFEMANQSNLELSRDTYIKIIQGKTSSLFALAAKAGAIIGGVRGRLEDALAMYGMELGQAFQLTDDAIDYMVDEDISGKARGQDLKGGKLTYPLIVALEKACESERAVIREAVLSSHLAGDQLHSVSEIINKYDGIKATRMLAAELSTRAKDRLLAFKPSMEREALMGIADHAVNRSE